MSFSVDVVKAAVAAAIQEGVGLEEAVTAFRRTFLLEALRRNGGSISRTAATLGVHRNTIDRQTHELGLKAEARSLRYHGSIGKRKARVEAEQTLPPAKPPRRSEVDEEPAGAHRHGWRVAGQS